MDALYKDISNIVKQYKIELKTKGYHSTNGFMLNLIKNYMEIKELKIQIPDGYEIDKENSTFECIKFKKLLTYENIIKQYGFDIVSIPTINDNFSAKLMAISKLMVVAKYLNNGWIPNFKNIKENKYSIYYIAEDDTIDINIATITQYNIVYFRTLKLAEQAIKILGKETIKQALSNNYGNENDNKTF